MTSRIVLSLVGFAWVAGIAFFAHRHWPRLPLDVSAADPATVGALNAAIWQHAIFATLIAVVPVALLLLLFGRVRPRR